MAYGRMIAVSASEERLEKLIRDRLKPGADKAVIDQRIWDLFGEEWCVMFTDLSGFSRRVEKFGIIHFLQTIHESERLLSPIIDDYDGILLKSEGDSMLVIFRNVNKAIQCCHGMHNVLREYNSTKSPEEEILLCIGLGYGKMLRIGDQDVFGDQVNAASKLGEDYAKAWDVFVTGSVMEEAKDMEGISFTRLEVSPAGVKEAYSLTFN